MHQLISGVDIQLNFMRLLAHCSFFDKQNEKKTTKFVLIIEKRTEFFVLNKSHWTHLWSQMDTFSIVNNLFFKKYFLLKCYK